MNINVEDGTIQAKSYHANYIKEAAGVTPNTVRIVDEEEKQALSSLQPKILDEAVTIEITDADDTTQTFRRRVTDIAFEGPAFGRWWAKITWKHIEI